MDPHLQLLLDERNIRRLIMEYAHGCDRCDETLMASVYAAQSWDNHGFIAAAGQELAHRMTQEIIPGSCDTLSHLLGQSLIELDGNTARAETYYLAVTLSTVDGTRLCNQLGGRYADRLVRDGDAWKIEHRVCMRDWSVSHEVIADILGKSKLVEGVRGKSDCAANILGLIA